MEESVDSKSLLDRMIDGKEYASIINAKGSFNLVSEIRNSISEIEKIRNKKVVCLLANMNNRFNVPGINTAIDSTDELPFSEMINSIDSKEKGIDIILITPGGSLETVIKFVNMLRPRFTNVSFLLPYSAMSAGTVFCMSGDEIVMSKDACIGPIDPQVVSKGGRLVPAQAVFSLIERIKEKGIKAIKDKKDIDWTDIQFLKNIDPKELGNALLASKLSISTVADFLFKYKFKNWLTHSDGTGVTEDEKKQRALKIASNLCDHSIWKSHGHPITREIAESQCELKITKAEDANLERPLRRFRALISYLFEKSTAYKIYISSDYSIIKSVKIQ